MVAATLTVRVTDWPKAVRVDVTVGVMVTTAITVWVEVAEAAGQMASPLYSAMMVWVPTVSTVVGARAVQKSYGYDGAGIGIAVIDSGITSWHDDLTSTGPRSSGRSSGNQRVVDFVDFVNGRRGA